MGLQKLKDATPAGVLLGSGKLATELDRLDLIDEYRVPRPPEDRRPRPDPVPERAAQHATARAGLGEAAPQRRGRHALPARALTQSSPIASHGTSNLFATDVLFLSSRGRVGEIG
jgi:hypothetical protein